jgi:fucose permease
MHILLLIIYLAFISLGLPDSLLGSAWPTIYQQIDVPISYSGIIFVIISCGTIISSLNSDRINKRFSTGVVTAVSTGMTAMALFGFATANSFWQLCLFAIPYGLGAGSIDAALNNYVALHYASRHMSWLHCMWGVGASIGPYIMSIFITNGNNWHKGYFTIGLIQAMLTFVLFMSLPLWKKEDDKGEEERRTMSLKEIISIEGVKEIMFSFFCYCGLEQTCGLWAASWLVKAKGILEARAAAFASLYFLGITFGRLISGFITYKLDDKNMIRLGFGLIIIGIMCLFQSFSQNLILYGLLIIGLGSAPIYPSLIHSVPELFGPTRSQSIIGVQMASAYVGNILLPPLFGILADRIGINLFPYYLVILLLGMMISHEKLRRDIKA